MQYPTNCFEILVLLYNENNSIRFTVLSSLLIPCTIQFECQFRQIYMLKPQVGQDYVV